MTDTQLLTEFSQLVTELNKTPGTNAKIDVLRLHSELQPLLKRIWDPDTTTGITRKGLDKARGKPSDEHAQSLYTLFDDLTTRKLSGDRARGAVWNYVGKHPTHQDTILGIVEKSPRVRMGSTLLLRAFPGIFNIFRVVLAEEWTQADFDKAYTGKAWISQKIDGMRLITVIEKGDIQFYSRKGHPVTSLEVLRRDMAGMPDGVIDGEICAINADGSENFKESISQARRKDVQMKNPRYKIFDYVSLATFRGADAGQLFETRLAQLQQLPRTQHCEVLEQVVWTPEVFKTWQNMAQQHGWEGLMIRHNTLYVPKRSRALQKYKFMQTEEFTVIDLVVEKMPFANSTGGETFKPALNSVIIMYKNCRVNVGSGFSASERLMFAEHPEQIVGKLISVKYQEAFYDDKKDQHSLRCPIFMALIEGDRDY